jgi:DNA polymerase I
MRELVIRGGPWSAAERESLLEYCASDVDALARLLGAMAPRLDIERALLRGRYMVAAALMKHTGVPIDVERFETLRTKWDSIQNALIDRIEAARGLFEGRSFNTARFRAWLVERGIAWPHLVSGALALDDQTFRDMARAHPELQPVRDLRYALAKLRVSDIAVGPDGRNRTLLSAFRAKTGRNQPSNAQFIFGPAKWLRGTIRPQPGTGLAYIDWSQQEFGIAAALSGDAAMMDAYASGDPYLAFAKRAGAVPPDATRQSHAAERSVFKQVALGVQYGMGADALALRLGVSTAGARELLGHAPHHVSAVLALVGRGGRSRDASRQPPHRLRLDDVRYVEPEIASELSDAGERRGDAPARVHPGDGSGVRVCAPIHDAVLIESPLSNLDESVSRAQAAMLDASRAVLGGFELDSDAKLVRAPDRYMDEGGTMMWNTVWDFIDGRSP